MRRLSGAIMAQRPGTTKKPIRPELEMIEEKGKIPENRADTELKGLASLDSSNDGNDNFRSSRTNSQESSTGDIFLHTPSVAKTLQSGDQLLIDDLGSNEGPEKGEKPKVNTLPTPTKQ